MTLSQDILRLIPRFTNIGIADHSGCIWLHIADIWGLNLYSYHVSYRILIAKILIQYRSFNWRCVLTCFNRSFFEQIGVWTSKNGWPGRCEDLGIDLSGRAVDESGGLWAPWRRKWRMVKCQGQLPGRWKPARWSENEKWGHEKIVNVCKCHVFWDTEHKTKRRMELRMKMIID